MKYQTEKINYMPTKLATRMSDTLLQPSNLRSSDCVRPVRLWDELFFTLASKAHMTITGPVWLNQMDFD
jgi:hypothetical protein